MRKRTVTSLVVLAALLGTAGCQKGEKVPEYVCKKVLPEVIKIDGKIDEPVWKKAKKMWFKLVEKGEKPDESTWVKSLWSDKYLYLAYHINDKDIWASMTNRDDHLWEAEVVEAFICSSPDRHYCFEFEVNPLNALLDCFVISYRESNFTSLLSWNCRGIQHAVTVNGTIDNRNDADKFWEYEAAIPLAEICADKTPPEDGDVWRLNLYRFERDNDKVSFLEDETLEISGWSPTYSAGFTEESNCFHKPAMFGKLIFKTTD